MRNTLSQLLAIGPELAAYILTSSLLAATPTCALKQSAISSPNLDLSQLGRVAIGGDFDSVSLYTYQGQNENLSSNGSQSILTRYPNGAWESLALVDADATIEAMCAFVQKDGTDNGIIVAGNFTSLGSVHANSIALWNPDTDKVTALPGLTGPVRALYCDRDSSTVYVGGNFMGGNSTNAMAWTTGWVNLPFAGFNGPVNSITKNSAGNIVFGGEFTGLGNASTPATPDAQVVNLGGGTISASATTGSTSTSKPDDIICSTPKNNTNWLLPDGVTGYWEGSYGFGFVATKLRLYNANVDGRGTKTFNFQRMNDAGILNLTYVDPSTGQNQSCTRTCPLPQNNSTAQDFHFVNFVGTSDFRINILDWYGAGGGLSGIELFQDDIYSYAINSFNEPQCDGVSDGSSSTVSPPGDGTWVRTANRGLTPNDFLTARLTTADEVNSNTNVVFKPNIQQSGNYSVTVYTPGCILDGTCGTRGQVNMTGSMTGDQAPVTTTLFQTNNYDKFDQIYYGYIDVDGGAFSPTVTLSPVSGQSVPLTVVASRVRFELISSTGGLNGLFEYNPNKATVDEDFSTSAVNRAGSGLNTGASVNAVVQNDRTAYVGGAFATDNFANIMSITDNATALAGGGLNGEVLSLHMNGSNMYVGGTFSSTRDNGPAGLNNVASYSLTDNTWTALGAGVDASVFEILPLTVNVTSGNQEDCVAISGNFSSVNAFDGNKAFKASGFAVWVPSRRNWLGNIADASAAISGFLTAYAEVPDMPPVYAGRITSQDLGYADAVELVGSGNPTIATLGTRLQQSKQRSDSTSSTKQKRALSSQSSGQNYTGVYDGIFYHENNFNITILGGNFAATASNGSTVENLVFINNTDSSNQIVNGVSGLDSDSIIVAMDTYNTLVFAGGALNGTVHANEAAGLVVFDLLENDYASPHPPALGGDNVVVNAVATQPSSTMIFVGGSFDTAGSLQCRTLCAYDAGTMQWQNVASGLSGTINTMVWASNTLLLLAGNITVNGVKTTMATWDTKKQDLTEYAGASTLPGPIIALSAVNDKYDEFWVSGIATANSSVYLARYSDDTWTGVGGLGDSTTIRKLQIMPLTSDHDSSALMAQDQSLMLLGDINIPNQGNASAVLFDGTTFEPYILTNMQDGTQGSLSAIFVSNPQNFMSNNDHHLALGLVVLIGLAIALALIFIMVVVGILLERRRRRKEGYVPMTVDKSSNIARLPPETLFQNLEGKPSPPKL